MIDIMSGANNIVTEKIIEQQNMFNNNYACRLIDMLEFIHSHRNFMISSLILSSPVDYLFQNKGMKGSNG